MNKLVLKMAKEYLPMAIFLSVGLYVILLSINTSHQSERVAYRSVTIDYDNHSEFNIRDYAIKLDHGNFLLAGDTPDKLKLALNFHSSETVNVKIKPLYPDWLCAANTQDGAILRFRGEKVNTRLPLTKNQDIDIRLRVFDGDAVTVSLSNSGQKNCGRAELEITEASNQILYYPFFVVLWALVFLLFRQFGFSPYYVVLGVTINCLLVFINTILVQTPYSSLVNASFQSLFVVGYLLLIQNIFRRKALKVALISIPLISLFVFFIFYLGHYFSFDSPVSSDAIHAVLQSNSREVLQFLESTFSQYEIVFVLLLIVIVAIFVNRISALPHKGRSVGLLLGGFFTLPLMSSLPQQLDKTPFANHFLSATKQYFHELTMFNSLVAARENQLAILDATLTRKGQKVVVIIGESANKNHMSLYGYPRDTTPMADALFDAGDLIRFTRAYANHTHTGGALSYALTSADLYSAGSWTSSPSILSLANSLDIDTVWISNQQTLGAWDNQVSSLAHEANQVVSRNKLVGVAKDSNVYDGALIENLEQALSATDKSQLIFLHLQGSHVSYCRRFPEETAQFQDTLASKAEYGSVASFINRANIGAINCYDDSIYYTDAVISRVIAVLEKQAHESSLLYFSDHSEDVLSSKAHNSALFTYEMAEIPLLFWANDRWKTRYSNTWDNLDSNKSKLFTNDHIFETVSGLLGINASMIDSNNDLSSGSYKEVGKPTTLLGRKPLIALDNWRYWQQLNINNVVANEPCARIIPHRANSIGKIRSAIQEGLCGFEIDVYFENQNGQSIFNVGHDRNTMAEISLEDFIKAIPHAQVNKIWLDVKNVKDVEIPLILERLNYLDSLYEIKSKAIVETSFFGEEAKRISEAGYHLSYYLPTSAVFDSMYSEDTAQKALAQTIKERIVSMQPSAVSFDLKIYSFVKNYLEPLIQSDVKSYHTWFPEDLHTSTPNLLTRLSSKPYHNDERVKTILLPHNSPFNL